MSNKQGILFLQDGSQIKVQCESRYVSDGSHSFDDLYLQRNLLLIALMREYRRMSWKSRRHDDGTSRDGMFIVGMRLPKGDVTFHMPNELWPLLIGIETKDMAPAFDGHTSHDVIDRITRCISEGIW